MNRREYHRAFKVRQRAKEKLSGSVTITVKLTAEQAAIFFAARERQRGPLADFAQRCMTRGAMFLANSGNPRGKKLRIPVGTVVPVSLPSPVLPAAVDMSTSSLEAAA